ncbi:MAG TPA: YitT family protein, partial [Bacteroidales bacterium]|nr:YitT family protein [Bacteroidales bacterium]
EEVSKKILIDLNRGGTFIRAKGMYSGQEKDMIYTVVNRREVAILQDYIRQIDPNAFMSVIDANEIVGNGFKPFSEMGQ